MAVNKNFVVKNGLEVATNLIFTDTENSKVGFGTTSIDYTVHVIGGIGATDLNVTGIATFNGVNVDGSFQVGVVTATEVYADFIDLIGVSLSTASVTTGVSTSANISVGTAGTTITTLTGGKVGIGTTNALHRFQVGSANATGFTTTTSGLFVVTYDGKVGVQTGQPTSELHVFGNETVTGVITATTFYGDVSGTATTATNSNNSAILTSSNNSAFKVPFANTTGSFSDYYGLLQDSDANFTYNPSTNTLTVPTIQVTTAIDLQDSVLTFGSSDDVKVFYDGNDLEIELESTANKIAITDNGTYKHLITRDGKVGINTSTTPTVELFVQGNANITGVVTATSYYGSGSNLSGVTYGIGIRSDGSTIAGAGVTVIDFTGSGISTVTASSGIATIYVEGGGGSGGGSGGTSTEIEVTNDTASAATHYITFTTGASSSQALKVDTSTLSYVPSTNNLTASTFTGALSGNATSATTATNANNINISATTSTDTTTSVVLVGSQSTGNQSPFIDSGLTYNAGTNNLTATTFTGALSGNATSATTATTATNATNTAITNTTTSASTHYITFVDGTSGNRAQRVDSTGLTYIPDSNIIGASISGNAATVTTNANLTGDVTSVGNATAIAAGVIVNNDINASAAIAVSKLAASTISGITLGNDLATLTRGTYLTGSNYNGSTARTWAVDATTTNTASKVVARDASGDFAANVITCVDLNSTSDINLKDDIRPFENALATVNRLNGVHFTWKKDDRKSIGVIAQEIEKILPELVTETEGNKTVNYNGLIGVLIEAVKELSEKVEILESKA